MELSHRIEEHMIRDGFTGLTNLNISNSGKKKPAYMTKITYKSNLFGYLLSYLESCHFLTMEYKFSLCENQMS